MIMKNGRISWPLFFSLVYGTFVLLCTDLAWRMLAGPFVIFAAGGFAALLIGCIAILLLGKRRAE